MGIERFLAAIKTRFAGPSEQDSKDRLSLKYHAFNRLVEANTAALDLMADMQAKASGDYLFDRAYVEDVFGRLLSLTSSAVQNLQELSGDRYKALDRAMDQTARAVRESAEEPQRSQDGLLVVNLSSAGAAPLDLVGGKIRHLGEILTRVGLPVPDGFCVTAAACGLFLGQDALQKSIRGEVERMSFRDKEELNRASQAIKAKIVDSQWPSAVSRAILEACASLEWRAGGAGRLSVRSSAAGEDGEFSFAGQFETVLNVEREALLQTCKEVLASQFTPRALIYLKARGMSPGALPMAIGVIRMVDARASGVLYTRDPQDPQSEIMTVAGLWGLGNMTVDGSMNPDIYTLSWQADQALKDAKVPLKTRMLLCGDGPGLIEVAVPGWMQDQPCLSKEQLTQLRTFGRKLEEHYGRPQDVEWAVDAKENLFILQSRPLKIFSPVKPEPDRIAARQGLKPLFREGTTACKGCAAGEVYLLASDEDLHLVPTGAVLVARAASPKLAEAVYRISAIVTDMGSAASHLATVAREIGIPSIFGTRSATEILKSGMTVTVDGDFGNVYEGRIEALLKGTERGKADAGEPPLLKRFRKALGLVTPLNLTDPRAPGFKASGCKTVHDILRFAHEAAVQEIFAAGRLASRGTKRALKLDSPLPLDFYFIDLGGGLKAKPGARTVTPEEFTCRPLIPLWDGVVSTPWSTDPAASARGMASVMATTLTARTAMEQAAEPNYVLVSETFLNLSFRLGYHFSRVDAHLSERPEENYASLLFYGGAADSSGRARRVRFIAKVLGSFGFVVTCRADALFARTDHVPPNEMAERLKVLGRILVATRQADTLLDDDAMVDQAVSAFLAGDPNLGLNPLLKGSP